MSFISATLLPLGSEALLLYYASDSTLSLPMLWGSASVGNTLGGMTNWLLGRYFLQYKDKQWFPMTVETHQKAERFFNRYGLWSLLFTWLPVVGDGIALISGVLGAPIRYVLPFVFIGKAVRYALLLWGSSYFLLDV